MNLEDLPVVQQPPKREGQKAMSAEEIAAYIRRNGGYGRIYTQPGGAIIDGEEIDSVRLVDALMILVGDGFAAEQKLERLTLRLQEISAATSYETLAEGIRAEVAEELLEAIW